MSTLVRLTHAERKACKVCGNRHNGSCDICKSCYLAVCKNCDGVGYFTDNRNTESDCADCSGAGKSVEINCCNNEDNHFERDTDIGLCPKCQEHAGEIACKVCGEMVFISSCCG